ncbi:MAG: DUF5063 domain-containing protein [Staphylococcus sp.]|nr:DUF5063 domain-containing protein [Staphylococcus sp.]
MELSPNSLAFIALCNEFCYAVENAAESTPGEFVGNMLRLLPRIYISATDLKPAPLLEEEDPYIESFLEEDYYENLRFRIAQLLGSEDIYLEVFEEDMKYSETPIGLSVAEGICDVFQVLYNFIVMVKDAPEDIVNSALVAVKADFGAYWSQKLCNIMRPLNNIRYSSGNEEDDDDNI